MTEDELNAIDELLPEPQGAYQTLVERVSLLKHQRDFAEEGLEAWRMECERLRSQAKLSRAFLTLVATTR